MKAFVRGFICFFKGLNFSMSHFGGWFLIPLILWFVLVFGLSFFFSDIILEYLYDSIERITGIDLSKNHDFSNWKSILTVSFEWVLNIVVYVFFWYLLSRYMKYLVLILLSPLFAYLSEQTEEILTKKKYPFEFKQLVKDSIRGLE